MARSWNVLVKQKCTSLYLYSQALRILYSYKMPSFETFKGKDGSVFIRNINIQVLVADVFKISNNILSFIMKNFCVSKELKILII